MIEGVPYWMTKDGYKLFTDKYLYDAKTPKEQYERIARTLSRHTLNPDYWVNEFFDIMWRGAFSCSTPCLANAGTSRGLPVSCTGNYVEDSVLGFFNSRRENALLSKYGHGTSSYLGDIRKRGSPISVGGEASGSITELVANRSIAQEISQGMTRRGSWAGYLPIDHGDFWEWWNFLHKFPDDTNIGWSISDGFIERLKSGCSEADSRWKGVMYLRALYGRGYMFYPDKVGRRAPDWMKEAGYRVHASNLCTEITLPSNETMTFSCVLGSINLMCGALNLSMDVFTATVMLDCLVSEYLILIKDMPGMEKVYNFTEKFRALGLGVIGLHSYFQSKSIRLDSLQAGWKNVEIFSIMEGRSEDASLYLRNCHYSENTYGRPLRNSHRLAMMPTVSTSEIMGGYSEGINPMIANVFSKTLANGDRFYINPVFREFMEDRVKDERERQVIYRGVSADNGSVMGVKCMTPAEKLNFRTAFEIPQRAVLRLASQRQPYICQGQSINLHFSNKESEEVISDIHRDASLDENILSLYYMRTAGSPPIGDDCEVCQ